MAAIDLPESIGYVLNATGAEKLAYVGHSQARLDTNPSLVTLHPYCRSLPESFIVTSLFQLYVFMLQHK